MRPMLSLPALRRPVALSALAAAALAAAGCDPGGLDDQADTRPPIFDDLPDDGVTPPPPRTGSLTVAYASSLRPGEIERSLGGVAENDLYKFADNEARVRIRPGTDQAVVRLEVTRDDVVIHDAPIDGQPDAEQVYAVPLATGGWPEGIHRVRYRATTDAGAVIEGEEEVRVYFNVTTIAADPDDPHLLWLGTADVGLLAYHLGDDALDPADDRVHTFGGHALELVDITPPRGRPWQGEGGYEGQRAPAGQLVMSTLRAQGGVFVGAAWRGVSYLDPDGTPWVSGDDRYALFHPGMNLEPSSFEAGLANSVTAIVADGETGLWFGTFGGLFHVDHGGTLFDPSDDVWTVFDSTGAYDPNITRIAVDDGGRVWLASFDAEEALTGNTVTLLDPGGTPSDQSDDTWVRLALPEGFPAEATALAVEGARVYIGTSAGLYLLDHRDTPLDPADDIWRRLTLADGLHDDDIAALAVRPDGRLWVGAFDVCLGDGGGLMLLDPAACLAEDACAPIVTYTVDDGLLDDDVSSLHLMGDGRVALGTFNLFAAPAFATLFARPAAEDCEAQPDPERNLGPAFVGRDGLSVIDPGADLADKGDDALINL